MRCILPDTISRKRGIVLRINEAYEHEPILTYQSEDSCPASGCNKTGTQCVDIAETLTLTPEVTTGTAVIACQGSPSVSCETAADGASCTVVVTQRVCVSVPIRFNVVVETSDPAIACADSSDGIGTCSCG